MGLFDFLRNDEDIYTREQLGIPPRRDILTPNPGMTAAPVKPQVATPVAPPALPEFRLTPEQQKVWDERKAFRERRAAEREAPTPPAATPPTGKPLPPGVDPRFVAPIGMPPIFSPLDTPTTEQFDPNYNPDRPTPEQLAAGEFVTLPDEGPTIPGRPASARPLTLEEWEREQELALLEEEANRQRAAIDAQEEARRQQMAAVQEQMALFKSMFPAPDTSKTQAELAMEAEAAKESKRTALLAQLAFASGLVGMGGESWKPLAQGMAAAGGVYDDGFKRYQATLEKAANREMQRRETNYKYNSAIAEAGYKAYADQQTAGREAVEARRKAAMDFFKEIKPDTSGDSLMSPEADQARKDWAEQYRQNFIRIHGYDPMAIDVTQ